MPHQACKCNFGVVRPWSLTSPKLDRFIPFTAVADTEREFRGVFPLSTCANLQQNRLIFLWILCSCLTYIIRRIVTFLIIAPYKYSYLLTYLLFSPPVTLNFDLLTPKVDCFIPCSVDPLRQFAAKSVHSFSKYRPISQDLTKYEWKDERKHDHPV